MTHVLVVEDHEGNRNLLGTLLEANGYRVTAAGDSLEALAAARCVPPDAIVSDVPIPKLDGFALCRAWMQDATNAFSPRSSRGLSMSLLTMPASLNCWKSTAQASGCRIHAPLVTASSNFARAAGRESAALSAVLSLDVVLSCCMHSSRSSSRHLIVN